MIFKILIRRRKQFMRIADKGKPDFKTWLKHENLAPATIENYVWTVNYLSTHYPELNKENLLDRYNDLSLLTDLMGHEDIETTRIYLRKTSTEQREIVDRVVNW